MLERPNSVTIISLLLIVYTVIYLVIMMVLIDINFLSTSLYIVIGLVFLLPNIVMGIGMLDGQNWARLLFLWLTPVSIIIGFLSGNASSQSFIKIVWYIILAIYLTRPVVTEFFTRVSMQSTKTNIIAEFFTRAGMPGTKANKIETILIFSFLVLFTLGTIYPVFNIISISLRTDNAFQTKSLAIWESEEPFTDLNGNEIFDVDEPFIDENNNNRWDSGSSFKSFITLFRDTSFLRWAWNSFLVTFVVTLTGVVLASTSGYALSRFNFKVKQVTMVSLLTTQMFPATMLLLPFFILLSKLGLINSYIGLIIIYSSTALPFCIWQMKGYYDTIPPSLEESARLDGCSQFQAFYRIILPLSSPALVITALFSFMASWNEYVVANIVLQDPELYTLPLGLKSFQASLSTQWGLYAAGAVIVSIPVTVLFISLAKYLVSGLTMGSVKG